MKRILFFAFVALTFSCGQSEYSITNTEVIDDELSLLGSWRFSMRMGEHELPFNSRFSKTSEGLLFTISNDDELIHTKDIAVDEDSIIVTLPYYQSILRCRFESPNLITGAWFNLNKDNYQIPLIAEKGKDFRFTNTKSSSQVSNRYKVSFGDTNETGWDAVLLLHNDEGYLSGTFLTETGDFRFLEGNIMNEKVYLSTFDGSHAFLFEARISGDSLIDGLFKSGKHYETKWNGHANTDFELSTPTSLTHLIEGYDFIDFNLPNQNGDTTTWDDLNLQNKVVVIDIMGSWCPNCMDASVALDSLLKLYPEDDIKLITIAFELTNDFEIARKRITKMQNQLNLKNEFLFGGLAKKQEAAKKLPMLDHIMSYPTLIFISKERKIAQIYTGFYGPGTGVYYSQFFDETKTLLDSLIAVNSLARN